MLPRRRRTYLFVPFRLLFRLGSIKTNRALLNLKLIIGDRSVLVTYVFKRTSEDKIISAKEEYERFFAFGLQLTGVILVRHAGR